jgi:phage terminase large subunit
LQCSQKKRKLRLINKNFKILAYHLILKRDKRGIVLEGGSRSGKTWATIDFLIQLCAHNKFKGLTINIIKETYAGFKTTIYNDFAKRLTYLEIENPFATVRDVPSFSLFGNRLNFIGADQASKFHGAGCDYFWINEAMDVQQTIFDQLEMRCKVAWILDYNPKFSMHWIFDKLEKRPDVLFFASTMLDNPFVSSAEKVKILSYEPTKINIDQGTADDYMFAVYGLGKRAAQTGLIFPYVTWIDRFPEQVERVWFGLDFGYTVDPTALVKIGVSGTNIYLEERLYNPVESADVLYNIISPVINQSVCWCDSADPGMIKDLQKKGLKCFPALKKQGSIQHGIDVMKRFKLNIVNSPNFRKEQENYAWRTIQGIQVNEPIDQFNHLWDASRYGCQMELSKKAGFTI